MTRAEKDVLLAHAFTEYVDSGVPPAPRVPTPPFWGPAVVTPEELDLGTVMQYVNKKALYRLQWQYRQGKRSEPEYTRFVAETVEPRFKELVKKVRADKTLEPRVVYGWWPCHADRNSVGIVHSRYGSLHNAAEMKREPIRRLRGPYVIADRVEVVAKITNL
jgi:5-methyltetrahydrofolate--homocysteine methyltransferase